MDIHVIACRHSADAASGHWPAAPDHAEAAPDLREIAQNFPGTLYQFRKARSGRPYFAFLSNGLNRLYGVAPAEVLSDAVDLFDFVDGDEAKLALAAAIDCSARYLSYFDAVYPIVTRGGKKKWVRARSAPRLEADGTVVWDGVMTDVTREFDAKTQLDRAEQLAQLGHWSFVPHTGRLLTSAGTDTILGSDADADGRTAKQALSLIHPDDRSRVEAMMKTAARTGTGFEIETRIVRPDGGVRDIHIVGEADTARCGLVLSVFGTCQDVTEWKNVQTRLAEATRKAQRANMAKSMFLSAASHELRTPLNAILGMTEALSLGILGDVANDRQKGYLDDILTSARHLSTLVSDLLDLSGAEQGTARLDRAPHALDAIITESLRLVKPLADRNGIVLTVEGLSDRPVFVDRRRMVQVLVNIVSNAIKFSPHGGRVGIEATVGEVLTVAVRDEGIGIADDQYETIFEPFVRLDNAVAAGVEGSGIGLAVCKQLVECHGGMIGAGPGDGTGTRVWFTLPLDGAAAAG